MRKRPLATSVAEAKAGKTVTKVVMKNGGSKLKFYDKLYPGHHMLQAEYDVNFFWRQAWV